MIIDLERYFDVVGVEVVDDYTLHLTFDDGTEQTIDFEPLLYGPVFAPLRDRDLFNQVQVNADTGTIEWSTGADFNPTILHDWPRYRDKIIEDRQRRFAVTS